MDGQTGEGKGSAEDEGEGQQLKQPPMPPSPGSHAKNSDTKLLAALRHELEASRGRLTIQRRKELATRLLEHSHGDETFFTRLSKRMQDAGVTVPSVTVEYRGLKVETDALVGAASVPTVASVPLGFFKRLLGIDRGRESRPLTILNSVQGRLVPGRLTLLLGPPSCGKSTFMRALAARLIPAQGKMSGDIRFNGYTQDQFNILRTAAYVAQIDNHNPNLTVRETLDFAHACQMGLHGAAFDVPAELAAHRIAIRRHSQPPPQNNGTTGNGNGPNDAADAIGAVVDSNGGGAVGNPNRQPPKNKHVSICQVSATNSLTDMDSNGANANGHAQEQRSPSARLLRALSSRKQDKLLDEAEDEFEALLRQAWGTQVRVDIVMALLGLTHCAETLVGDQITRGISGGERKRLTTAEMLVGPSTVLMLDEISTGLDSATLYTVIRWLSQACKALQQTTVVSLLQPPPEVFGLFDDVILMTEGRILYHGPVTDVVDHFRSLGFDCPDRKDVPSFLLEITTPAGQREFAGNDLRTRFNLPPPEKYESLTTSRAASAAAPSQDADASKRGLREGQATGTAPGFRMGANGANGAGGGGGTDVTAAVLTEANASVVSCASDSAYSGSIRGTRPKTLLVPLTEIEENFWTKNPHGVAMAAKLRDHPVQPAGPRPPPPLVPREQRFALGPLEAIVAATRRQTTLVTRDKVLLKGRVMQVIVISLLTGSLFYNQGVTLNASRTIFGACFMSVLFMSFGSFPQLPITMELKKVWYKHRSAAFYPAYAQSLAMALSQLPLSAVESTLFSLVIYFMVNFYREPGYFFTFLVIIATTSLSVSALFRFFACVCPSMVVANAVVGLSIVCLVLTSGFAIVHYSIPPWAIWAYWISPHAYALRSLVINEMVSPKWQNVPAPEGMPGGTLGNAALLSFDFYTTRNWIWIGVGFLVGSFLLFTFASGISLHYQQPEVPVAQLPDPEELLAARKRAQERHAKTMQEAQKQLSSRKEETTIVEVRPPVVSSSSEPAAASAFASAGKGALSASGMVASPSMAAMQDFIDISSSLPFTPITLVFQDLTYSVPNPAYSRSAAKAAAKADAARQTKELSDVELATSSPPGANGDPGAKAVSKTSAPSARASSPSMAASSMGPPAAEPDGPAASMAAKERLQLLGGITGFNEPGVLLALMGGSGAGKTTLMDVIAGRKTIGEIGGTITVNGHEADPRAWSRVMGYVEQNDIHSPGQTVIEALQFSARLRLPKSCSDLQVKAYVEEVLEIVDLLPLMGSLVGSPGESGLSVEARKRLTIAVELVANPSCVFLDEPTSGLDARAAAIVMRAVRNVARNGRTVMVTIHQPSIEIFESFDNLLLIQRGGVTTYFGPLGRNSSDLIAYLRAVPGTPPLPPGFNPATWMLEVTGGSMATVLERVEVDWPHLYGTSELAKRNEAMARTLVEEGRRASQSLQVGSQYAMNFGRQFRVLLRKFNLAYWRAPGYNFVRLGMTFVTSFIYSAIYWGEGKVPDPAAMANIQNVMGIMFSSSNFLGMTNLMSVMPVVGYERVVFYRERAASMYDPFAYGFAIATVELPYLLVQALTFVPITYFMIGFTASAEAFFYYIIVFLETISFYTIFGQALVYITPAQAIAQVVGGAFNFLFNIFNGFIITYPDIPVGWRWMNRIVPPTWILYGLGVSQLGNHDATISYGGQTLSVSDFMESRFGYYYYMRWWIVLILLAYILVFRVWSILALKYWNFLRR